MIAIKREILILPLAKIFVFAAIFAIALAACGVHEDNLQCVDLCDKKRSCFNALDDLGWDECFADCELQEYTINLAACVTESKCEGSFESMIEACFFDPLADEE